MKRFTLLAVGCSLFALSCSTPALRAKVADPEPRDVAIAVSKLLEQMHYSHHPLDDTISDRTLRLYLEILDFNHLFFTQKDVAGFEQKFDTSLDDSVILGDFTPAFGIYDLYLKRVEERVAKVKELLKANKFDYASHRTIDLNRQKAPWPKDEAEADDLWHDRVENEVLTESLAEHPIEPPLAAVTKRYDRLLGAIHEQDREDVVRLFLNAVVHAYDPHSDYFTPADYETFSTQMRLSLVGIGARLSNEDGYAKIIDLMTGGPAEKEGSLKPNDKIAAVAQGNGPFVDVVHMKLDKVVAMIRGKAGTTVRLQVVPASSPDPSKRKIVSLVRNEVKLTDQEVKAEVIEHRNERGETERLGWITLPSFYADMNSRSSNAKSTTRDVRAILNRLNREGITGLVVDLRKNGGGSLEEAINLTGLFIKRGPVVQAKDSERRVTVSSDRDPSVSYAGPMVVLTNRLSASASEIFAGALQDYGRAVIVGDKSTFGKGTVQTLIEVGRAMSPFGFKLADAGALKLTIQKFYRPSGQSTQLKGVVSDVVLPSRFDHLDLGENALEYPLPYDEVKPADFEHWSGPHATDTADLRARSANRIKSAPEFRYVLEDIGRLDAKIAANRVSLNKAERVAELDAEKKRVEERKAERIARHEAPPVAYRLTLDDVDKPKLQRVVYEDKKKKEKEKQAAAARRDGAPAPEPSSGDDDSDAADPANIDDNVDTNPGDPIRLEALNILSDVIQQQSGTPPPELARTRQDNPVN